MIKAVFFDIDGVIIESKEANRMFLNDLFKAHGKKELSKEDYLKVKFFTIRQVLEKVMPEVDFEEREKIRREWSEKYSEYMELIELNSGIREILEFLKEKKFKLAVITNRTKTTVLEHFNLVEFFDFIVTASDVEEPKPSPEGILKAIEKFQVKADEVIYIGDTIADMQAGEQAKVKMIYFQEKVKGAKNEVIESFEELKKFL